MFNKANHFIAEAIYPLVQACGYLPLKVTEEQLVSFAPSESELQFINFDSCITRFL
ncbi:hypothetical protein ACP70R_004857 [Stipagrostis hirtigluma subsp. patula]